MSGDHEQPAFYANRMIQLMSFCSAATEMGPAAAWLVATVAILEDERGYPGSVALYNSELVKMLGFNSWNKLDHARKVAIQVGWLDYQPGHNRSPGKYHAMVPQTIADGFPEYRHSGTAR